MRPQKARGIIIVVVARGGSQNDNNDSDSTLSELLGTHNASHSAVISTHTKRVGESLLLWPRASQNNNNDSDSTLSGLLWNAQCYTQRHHFRHQKARRRIFVLLLGGASSTTKIHQRSLREPKKPAAG